MNRIVLFRASQGWMAQYVGPHRAQVMSLFETDTVPTAFTSQARKDVVLREISRLNPTVTIQCTEI